jgi:hypothetical protein
MHENKKYILKKKFKGGQGIIFPATQIFHEVSITFAIVVKKKQSGVAEYIFLNIHPDGIYYIRANWGEEDELEFRDISRVIAKFISPIITTINTMGKYAFIKGSMLDISTMYNTTYQGMNISVHWRQVISGGQFRAAIKELDQYQHAGIIAPKALTATTSDRFEFLFRKGIYQYDPSIIEKVMARSFSADIIKNQYSYLTNSTVMQKWQQNYNGRTARIVHRTTDVRFDIVDIKDTEFATFRAYMLTFILRVRARPDFIHAPIAVVSSKKLRRLHEQDPELYNLKKHGSTRLYSKLCQQKMQPTLFTKDEIDSMSAADKKKLVQYWNFTTSSPAFYSCTRPGYPHLGFITDVHPANYCIPCCNKKMASEYGVHRVVRDKCISEHVWIDKDDASSRHIMSYGKTIGRGRLGDLGEEFSKLFYVEDGEKFYFEGIGNLGNEPQNLINAMSIAFDMPMGEILRTFASSINADVMSRVVQGELESINLEQLKKYIMNMLNMGTFSQSAVTIPRVEDLLVELCHLIFGVNIIIFTKTIYISQLIVDELLGGRSRNTLMLFKTPGGLYHIIIRASPIKYFHDGEVVVRVIKGDAEEGRVEGIEDVEGRRIVGLITKAVVTDVSRSRFIDLADVKALDNWRIVIKYINIKNACYAVLVDGVDGGGVDGDGGGRRHKYVYVPIDYSVHSADSTPITFKPISHNDYPLKGDDAIAFISAINKKRPQDEQIIIGDDITGGDGSMIGFDVHVAGDNYPHYIFYTNDNQQVGKNRKNIGYIPSEVNARIMARAAPTAAGPNLGKSIYQNYMYQLFLMELSNYFDKERNKEKRELIRKMISGATDIGSLSKSLKSIISESTTYAILNIYKNGGQRAVWRMMEYEVFDFDHITMQKLRNMDAAAAKKEMKAICGKIMVTGDPGDMTFPNMFMPCAIDKLPYCSSGGKLIVFELDNMIDIFVKDIANPLFSDMFTSLWVDAIIDYFNFQQVPGETIEILKI